MRACCVPGCNVRVPLHNVPFTSGLRWKQWLKLCPFLLEFSPRQLEYMRICRRHFIPEHIDYEKRRLTKDSIPLKNLPPKLKKVNKCTKVLEISPIQPNRPVNVKVVNPCRKLSKKTTQTKDTFKCPSTDIKEKRQVTYLVCLKEEGKPGLPVDHNKYCLPFQTEERPTCLTSPCVMCQTPCKELLSNDRTIVCNTMGQELGGPVDHTMYCATPLPDDTFECLSSRHDQQTEPVDKDKVNIIELQHFKHLQEEKTPGTVLSRVEKLVSSDHTMYCALPLQDDTFECLSSAHDPQTESVDKDTVNIINIQDLVHMREERPPGAALSSRVSVASQTDADKFFDSCTGELYDPTETNEVPDSCFPDIQYSLQQELKTDTGKFLQNSQFVTLNHDSDMQDTVYILPSDLVDNESSQKDTHKQSSVYLSPTVFNLLTSKSPLEKETLESVQSLFSALKEQYNLPFNHVPTVPSRTEKITHEIPSDVFNNLSKPNHHSMVNTTANVVQPLQKKLPQKDILESLVAELTESVNAEEMQELEPSINELLNKTPGKYPTTHVAPSHPVQKPPDPPPLDPPACALHPSLAFNTDIRRVRLDKENSTPNERMLRMTVNKLRYMLKYANRKCTKLKSKLDDIQALAKPYLEGYPNLTSEAKALMQMQLRLAGTNPRAARYNEEDKLFALKLYQLSPDTYIFLQQYLKLPKRSTVRLLIKNA